jgi:hypothetical protein
VGPIRFFRSRGHDREGEDDDDDDEVLTAARLALPHYSLPLPREVRLDVACCYSHLSGIDELELGEAEL